LKKHQLNNMVGLALALLIPALPLPGIKAAPADWSAAVWPAPGRQAVAVQTTEQPGQPGQPGQPEQPEQPGQPIPAAPAVKAEAAIVMETGTGIILYEKAIHERHYPASTTKLMTLLLTVEAVERGEVTWEDRVTASALAESYGGSQIYLAEGEVLTLKELALGVALASGNDAAVAVAEYLGGSQGAFVEKMNQRAKELEMTDTHFVNANGLHDENHYTTAWDLCLLAREAVKHPELLEMSALKHYRIREHTAKPFQYDNKNKLLWEFEGAMGLKSGWTLEAGYCLAGCARRQGMTLVSVVLQNPEPKGHTADTKALLHWAFNTYVQYRPSPQELPQIIVQVNKGKTPQIQGVLPSQWGVPAIKGRETVLHYAWEGPDRITAPYDKEDILGYLLVSDAQDQLLARLPVCGGQSVERAGLFFMLKNIFTHLLS
jgi:D-alanyl-D-alanine carboxypeptidase (penicillin-binding protein 5/6)